MGALVGILIAVLHSPGKSAAAAPPPDPGYTWAAGAKRAPKFNLVDQNGSPVSLAGFRGRPVLLTFIDPRCHKLCPLEAKILASAEQSLPAAQLSGEVDRAARRLKDPGV